MKYLFIFIVLFSCIGYADDMPSYLKDGNITVTLTDGKTYEFSSNDFKVVPRMETPKPQLVPEANNDDGVVAEKTQEMPTPENKNRVRLMGGVGPMGFDSSESTATLLKVKQAQGAVGGVGYDRKLSNRWSVNGQALTNSTYTLGVGLDF